MAVYVIAVIVTLASVATLIFSALSYALRDLSRVRLGQRLEKAGRSQWLEPTFDHLDDLVVITATLRLLANTLIILGLFWGFEQSPLRIGLRYTLSFLLGGAITGFFSVAVPHAIARHGGDAMVASTVGVLHALRTIFAPLTASMKWIDSAVSRTVGVSNKGQPERIEQEILSAVEEGEKEGVVDGEERQMIESVIHFHDTTAGQVMTSRPEMIALPITATIDEIKGLIEGSGHSRIPIYEGSLDHIVGILYARDLLHHLGQSVPRLQLRSLLRAPLYVPETKPLADLLGDFRLQKVHIAIVLDEYGGTAGLVTIEDVLEELVGDISDEHEPIEPAMFRRIDEQTFEADARIYVDELNRLAGLNLPEDAGYETLGGFVSTTLGRIPETGTVFEQAGARFTVLDAEPQKVNRVKIEFIVAADAASTQPASAEPAKTA